MPLYIQTPRFVIREFMPEEEMTFLALFDDEMVTVHLPKRTKKDYIQIFKTTLADYEAGKTLSRWGMFNNGDGDFIGMCLLRYYFDDPDKIELGYSLHQKYWGKGVASEMAQIMVNYAFTHTNAGEVVGVTTLENISSQKVLEKAGLTRMDNFTKDGEELTYFRVTRSGD